MSAYSHRETVYRRVRHLLEANTVAVWVRRNYANTLDIRDFPAVVMFDGGADYQEFSSNVRSYTARVELVLAVRADDEELLAERLNELRASVLSALMADHTLGGLVTRVAHVADQDPDMPMERGRPPEMQMSMALTIEGQEDIFDPYRPAGPMEE